MKESDSTTFETSSEPTVIEKRKRGRGRPRKTDYQPHYNVPLGYQYVMPKPFPISMGYNNSLYRPPPFRFFSAEKFMNSNYNSSINLPPKPVKIIEPKVIPFPKAVKKEKKVKKQIEEEEELYVEPEEYDPYEKILTFENDKYLVKFKNKSYLHCEWLTTQELAASRGGLMKIKRFKPKTPPYDPDFIKVDRVIAEDSGLFLIKWQKLSYEYSTYEKYEDLKNLENFENELKSFRERRIVRQRVPLDFRPPKEYFIKFSESPKFKNDNTLRTYQLEGLNWLLNRWFYRQSCIMADEMGLGKTVQSVTFINTIYTKYNYCLPVLIISPLSTLIHWEREFKNWTDLRILVFHGNLAGRQIIYEKEFFCKNGMLFDVLITTYETVMSSLKQLQEINFSVGIFDEAHRLKNSNSKAVACLKSINFNHKILLSGTPLQNNLTELWSLLNFITPSQFFDVNLFLEEFKMESSEDVQRLQHILKPLMLRRMKEDVEKSIPLKEETIIEVELTMIQKRYYRAILEKNLEFLRKNNSESAPNLLNAMMELRKCCIHPYLIKGAEESIIKDYLNQRQLKLQSDISSKNSIEFVNEDIHTLYKDLDIHEHYKVLIHSSGKLVLLDKLLQKLHGSHKVLIFSQMTKCLDLLTDYLNYRQYKFERIDGSIRGDQRQAAIDRFCQTDVFVFLLCTRAGGVGINLTAADTVIIFDSDWNPQNDLQAQARCHRIGQTQEVKIYRLVTRNTYEREMFDKAGLKLGLDRAVLQKMSFDQSATMKKKDAVEILLKKGAYGVLMETDDASRRFCEEDIDQILERRTQIIRHQDGGNVFSKASFQVEEDIDDPDFWDNLLVKKEQKENEGRLKRLMRKLARESLTQEEKEEIDKEIIKNIEQIEKLEDVTSNEIKKDESDEKKERIEPNILDKDFKEVDNLDFLKFKLVFLMMLRRGIKSLNTLKFDYSNIMNNVYSYCMSQVPNKKQKEDLLCYVDLKSELYSEYKIYTDWCVKLLLRVQVPFILQALMKQTNITSDKSRWSIEDDKRLVNYTINHGYDNYPASTGTEKGFFKGKSADDLNQRIRKIILNLKQKIDDEQENNPIFITLILQFGLLTDKNKPAIISIISEENLPAYTKLTSEILEKSRRNSEENLLFERLTLFKDFFAITDLPVCKRKNLPKKWNVDSDYKLKDVLETQGLTDAISKMFLMSEERILVRMRELIDKFYEGSE